MLSYKAWSFLVQSGWTYTYIFLAHNLKQSDCVGTSDSAPKPQIKLLYVTLYIQKFAKAFGVYLGVLSRPFSIPIQSLKPPEDLIFASRFLI